MLYIIFIFDLFVIKLYDIHFNADKIEYVLI